MEIRNSAEMMQLVVLFTLFDGEPASWVAYLLSRGSATQKKYDLPFAHRLVRAQQSDESLLDDLYRLICVTSAREH